MTLSQNGIDYICQNFGDTNLCCVKTGLSWYYTRGGTNYHETGGTAQIVSRLASGLIDSLTMTIPARGTFTQAELNAANNGTVTVVDAQEITYHDEPTEVQWCYVAAECSPDGITKCIGYDLYTCQNGVWVLTEQNSEQCGYVPPECEPEGTTKCIGFDLYTCVAGKWQLTETNSEQCGYIPPECEPEGATKCVGSDLYTCTDSKWVLTEMNSPQCVAPKIPWALILAIPVATLCIVGLVYYK